MPEGLSIREMTAADEPAWAEIYADLFPKGTQSGMRSEIARILNSPTHTAYCAEIDGQIVGFAEYNIREFANGCVSKPVPFLEGIWVHPSRRGQGIARALIAHLEALARAQGHREFGSDVELHNQTALKMHDALGFEETERVVYFRKEI